MKRQQTVKFWRAIEGSTNLKDVLSELHRKKGYDGKRTLQRYAQAHNSFKNGDTIEVVSNRTGWSMEFVDKIYSWWEPEFKEVSPVRSISDSNEDSPPMLYINLEGEKLEVNEKDRTVTNVASVKVTVIGKTEVKGCRGWLITSGAKFRLCWARTQNALNNDNGSEIDLTPNKSESLKVAVTFAPVGSLKLSSDSEPPIPHESGGTESGRNEEGCWIYEHGILDNHDTAAPNYFPPGIYPVMILIESDNGIQVSKKYYLRSPVSWEELKLTDPPVNF